MDARRNPENKLSVPQINCKQTSTSHETKQTNKHTNKRTKKDTGTVVEYQKLSTKIHENYHFFKFQFVTNNTKQNFDKRLIQTSKGAGKAISVANQPAMNSNNGIHLTSTLNQQSTKK